MSRMLSRGTGRVRNASGTLPKTKTKTKYLFSPSSSTSPLLLPGFLRRGGKEIINHHLRNGGGPQCLMIKKSHDSRG